MFIFSKVLDQLTCITLLKINPIIDSSKNLPGLYLDYYLFDNTIMALSVSLKAFLRHHEEYAALGLTLKMSLGIRREYE